MPAVLETAHKALSGANIVAAVTALREAQPLLIGAQRRPDARLWRKVINLELARYDVHAAWQSCRNAVGCGALGENAFRELARAARRVATQLWRSGQFPDALAILGHPSCAPDPLLAARLQLELGNGADAEKALEEYSRRMPKRRNDLSLWRRIVKNYLEAGDLDRAWRSCQHGLAAGGLPQDSVASFGRAVLQRALALWREANPSGALVWLQHASAPPVPFLQAALLFELGRFEETEVQLRIHCSINPADKRDAQLWRKLIRVHLCAQEWSLAWGLLTEGAALGRLVEGDRRSAKGEIHRQIRRLSLENDVQQAFTLSVMLGSDCDAGDHARLLVSLDRPHEAEAFLGGRRGGGARVPREDSAWWAIINYHMRNSDWNQAWRSATLGASRGAVSESSLAGLSESIRRKTMQLSRTGSAAMAIAAVEVGAFALDPLEQARLLFRSGRDEEAVELLETQLEKRPRGTGRLTYGDAGGAVLIISGGSSGSHLLAYRLAAFRPFFAGPELNIAGEEQLFSRDLFRAAAYRSALAPDLGKASTVLSNGNKFFIVPPLFCSNAQGYGLSELQDILSSICVAGDWREFVMAIPAMRATGKGSIQSPRRLVEHSPSCAVAASTALSEYDDIRAIHLVRDPRDAIASMFMRRRKQQSMRGLPDAELLYLTMYQWCFLNWNASLAANHPRYMRVKYEDLAREFDGTLLSVIEHCGETPDRWRSGTQLFNDYAFPTTWASRPNNEVSTAGIGSFRQRLSPQLIDELHALDITELAAAGVPSNLDWYMAEFGYG